MQNNQNKKSINEKELEILKFWQDNKIFEKSLLTSSLVGRVGEGPKNDTNTNFTFYDGPPFATGLPHHGHILAGTIKDAIPRYQTMQGKRVRRVWGWDCHGLPIENMIEKELGLNSKKEIEAFGIDKFNQAAADSVLRYENEWKQIVPRLGRWVDMDNAYKTMDATYTESVWWSWKALYDKGLAYEGHKIMHICPRCETPLAQSEVGLEYHDVTDLSVTAKFELADEPNTFVLAWTTTPWTLPGNTALAVHKDIDYVKVSGVEDFYQKDNSIKEFITVNYILAKSKLEEYFKVDRSDGVTFDKDGRIFSLIEELKGEKLIGLKYKPIFNYFQEDLKNGKIVNGENAYKIWHADFITDDAGTGIAHEAPAFGTEDMELAKANSIPVIKHVQMNGEFVSQVVENFSLKENKNTEEIIGTKEFSQRQNEESKVLEGVKVKKKDDTMSTDVLIIKWLAQNDKLFEKHKIIHSYPLCWRCKTPLLNYATSSWFVDVPKIKDKLIEENSKVKWVPEHIRDGRFGKWLEGAREWAVSRRRYWGAPLPIWQSQSGKIKVIGSLAELAELNKNKSKNKYIVMRHGECISNTKNILDMRDDETNHLTENGKALTRSTREQLADKIDIIYTSPFLRTIETANIISSGKLEVIVDERLRESDFGEWHGKKTEDFIKWFNLLSNKYLDKKASQGESHRDIRKRVADFLLEMENKYEGKSILIVTHGGPANMLLSWSENLSDKQIEEGLFDENSKNFLSPAGYKQIVWKKVCYDNKLEVNLHRPYIDEIKLEIDGEEYTRVPDVFDCWYESGSMPYAQLHYPFENVELFKNNFPADFIAEGMDQTRGWFYSLINLGVALFDKAPYKHVIVNGVVMAGDGKKMSKSEKNYTDPMELVQKYGADALRLALANSPVMQGENVLFLDETVGEAYKKNIMKLENIVNMYLLNPKANAISMESFKCVSLPLGRVRRSEFKSENVLDKYIVARLKQTIIQVTKAYDNYKLDEATRPLEYFIDILSIEYVKCSRDRLKGQSGELDEVEATVTLRYVLLELSKLLAPMAPFIAERVYREVGGDRESVHLESWPKSEDISKEEIDIITKMTKTFDCISQILSERNKVSIPIRQPLALARLNYNDIYVEIVKDMTNIKFIELDQNQKQSVFLDTNITPDLKYEGDQRELSRIIKDMRREMGMVADDNIVLTIDAKRSTLLDEEYMKSMKIKAIKIATEPDFIALDLSI